MPHRAQMIGILSLALTLSAGRADQAAKPQNVPASGEHAVNGVKVELVELKRESPTEVLARWRYRNETGETRRLTSEATGPLDVYRLSVNSYLLDEQTQAKYPVERDSHNDPVASRTGRANEFITIYPKSNIQVWARYSVPEAVTTVTVVIEGVQPFARTPIAH